METITEYEVEKVNEMGVFKRIFNIFFEPGKVFKSIAEKTKILIPLIILMIGVGLLAIPTAPLMQDYSRQNTEKLYKNEKFLSSQKTITKDNADSYIEQSSKFVKIASYASPIIVLLMLLFQAAIFFGLFKILGGTGSFIQTFAVFIYSYFISFLGEIVKTVNIMVTGKVDVTNSIALLMQDDKTSFLYNFLSSLDLFGLWAFITAAIGLSIIHSVSRKKAYIGVFSLCLLFVLLSSINTTMQAANMLNQYGITL